MAGISTAGIESRFDKSIGIQQDSLAVLKDILSNVKTENVAKALSEAVAVIMKSSAANDKPTLKEKDEINMGRRKPTFSSSLDFDRKSA